MKSLSLTRWSLVALSMMVSLDISASSKCELVSGSPVSAYYFKTAIGDSGCKEVEDTQNLLQKILFFSEDVIKVDLVISNKATNATFDGGSIIEFPRQLIVLNPYGQEYYTSYLSLMTIVAHEFGHALLEKKLERELSGSFPDEVRYIKGNQEISQIKKKIIEIESRHEKSDELKNKLAQKKAELYANPKVLHFAKLTSGYSELYADVVAAFHDNDKDAMVNALYYDEMSDREFKMVQVRSFSMDFDSRYDIFMTEEHGRFALSRSYIGKNLWPKDENEKKVLLKKIGDAIVSEIKASLLKDENLLSVDLANKNLIEHLK